MFSYDKQMQYVDNMEQIIIAALGDRGALDAITAALDYDQKKEIYSYIIRIYDLTENDNAPPGAAIFV